MGASTGPALPHLAAHWLLRMRLAAAPMDQRVRCMRKSFSQRTAFKGEGRFQGGPKSSCVALVREPWRRISKRANRLETEVSVFRLIVKRKVFSHYFTPNLYSDLYDPQSFLKHACTCLAVHSRGGQRGRWIPYRRWL